MKIKIGDITSTMDGFSELTKLANETKSLTFDLLEVDFSEVGWFDGNMSAPLGVVLSRITDQFNDVKIVGMKPSVEGILNKNAFLLGFGFSALDDKNETTIPYRRFKKEEDRFFAAYLNKYLEGKGIPQMSESLSRRFKDSILEIFVNSSSHSKTSTGIFSSGQFFPRKQRVDFCVADAGIGIRRHIFNELGLRLNSDKAIEWAIQEGNTTKKGDIPGGLGLKLLRQFIGLNKGRIQIVSDRGYWECHDGKESASRFDLSFPGTAVNIEINTADKSSYCLSSELPPDNLS